MHETVLSHFKGCPVQIYHHAGNDKEPQHSLQGNQSFVVMVEDVKGFPGFLRKKRSLMHKFLNVCVVVFGPKHGEPLHVNQRHLFAEHEGLSG